MRNQFFWNLNCWAGGRILCFPGFEVLEIKDEIAPKGELQGLAPRKGPDTKSPPGCHAGGTHLASCFVLRDLLLLWRFADPDGFKAIFSTCFRVKLNA